MGAREYDPSLGRWLSADSIVPDPANPQSLNRYSYVSNNPLRYVDPSGHTKEDVVEEIESSGPFVVENPDDWTEEELVLLRDTIINHTFREGWASAKEIILRRQDVYIDENGRKNRAVGGEFDDSKSHEHLYTITIFDAAWSLEPAMTFEALGPRAAHNFAGNIAHELTHVVTEEHPGLVDSWLDAEVPGARKPVGSGYNWDQRGMDKRKKAKERIAMTVAAHMYQPEALTDRPPLLACEGQAEHWSLTWVKGMEYMMEVIKLDVRPGGIGH